MDTVQITIGIALWGLVGGVILGTPHIPAPRGQVAGRWGDDYAHHTDRASLQGMHGGPVDMRTSDLYWALILGHPEVAE